MDWYICEKTEDEYLNRTAGIKAREDLDVIFKQCGMKMINLVVGEDTRTRAGVISKIMGHIATKKYWEEKLACVHEGDTIYIQFPVRNHTVFLASVLKKLVQKNIRVVLFIHDFEEASLEEILTHLEHAPEEKKNGIRGSVCIKECDEYSCPQSSNEETNARGIRNTIREDD